MAARYKILDELGSGGAGAVFKAYDTQLDRYVALKRLMSREQADRQDEQAGTLKKEAASLATLQHPNIVSVYDLGSDDQGFFMVMELVDGETLSNWVRTTPMNLADFQELAGQSLEALLTAHGQSILHRDLKPENIKIKRLPGGRIQVKVLDFGLARLSYGAKKMTEDQSGNIVGSIYYMAPEQFMRRPVDVRTDLYSLGCVFYQALTCHRPYTDETVQGVMNAHLKHMVHPLKSLAPDVPQPICDWVMWLINAEPAHRPANAEAALASLREIINAGWFSESPSSAIPVAVLDVSQEGWHITDTVPRAPTTSHVRVASGAISQRINAPQSPSSTGAGSTHPPVRSTPLPARPSPRSTPPDEEPSKLPTWIWPTAAIAILVIAWQLWPKSGNSQPDFSNPKSAPNLAPRPSGFIQRGDVLHYIAGHKMDAWSGQGKPVEPAKPDSPVAAWQDLSLNGGEGTLATWDKEMTSCPTYVIGNPGGLKAGTGMLHFGPGSALTHRMESSDARHTAYPFGDPARSRGVTVMMIVRPQARDKEVRCLRLRNQNGSAWLDIRAYPSNEWKLTIKAGPNMKDAKITGSSTSQFSLVGATWNLNSATAMLSVRSEDGSMQRAETEIPKEPHGVLNELRISDYSSNPDKPVPATDRFNGDIVEIVVWPYAMEWEERSGQEWRLMQFYFKHPGERQ